MSQENTVGSQSSTPFPNPSASASTASPSSSPCPSPRVAPLQPNESQPETIDESDVCPSAEDNMRKRKCTSVVWNHFKRIKVNDQDKAKCNYCGRLLSGVSKHGTKHLHDHLDRCPRQTHRDLRQQLLVKQQSIADEKSSLVNHHFDQATSRSDLSTMIVLHEYPLNIVEHYGFRKYSSNLQPLFKMVSRNTIKRDILKMYDIERDKAMAKMEMNQCRVAITTDMWTSSNRKRGFMVVTAHYVDDDWALKSQVMRFIYVSAPYNKEVLSKALIDCLLEWNVDRKISTVTVDSCTNDAMIRIILQKQPIRSLMLHGSLFHMRCAAHILNLIVQDGLEVIGQGIEKVRESVLFWTASTKRRQKFFEAVRQSRIASSKELVLDCKTHWNSTYLMLCTALIYQKAFLRLSQLESLYTCAPSEEEWNVAKDICGKLEIFYIATLVFYGTTYSTANMFFPKVCELKIALTKWLSSSNEMVKKMASSMLEKYDSYWNVIHGVLGVAAVLDPRYKTKLLDFFFPIIYGDRSFEEIEKVRELCYDLLEEYGSTLMENQPEGGNSSSTPSCAIMTTTPDITQDSIGDSLLHYDLFVSSTTAQSGNLNMKMELDHYLEEAVLPRKEDFDILSWWKNSGLKYPTLQMIARDVLAIPISTVASESAFSTSGRLLSPHCSRLHSKTLEALMCTQNSKAISLEKAIQTILDDNDDDGDNEERLEIVLDDDDD